MQRFYRRATSGLSANDPTERSVIGLGVSRCPIRGKILLRFQPDGALDRMLRIYDRTGRSQKDALVNKERYRLTPRHPISEWCRVDIKASFRHWYRGSGFNLKCQRSDLIVFAPGLSSHGREIDQSNIESRG